MNIFLILIIALLLIIFLLRFKVQIGLAMLISGIFIWLMRSAEISNLVRAFFETFSLPRTYDIVFALYLIMCLEIELRRSGAFDWKMSLNICCILYFIRILEVTNILQDLGFRAKDLGKVS